jgi:hypothetical protein
VTLLSEKKLKLSHVLAICKELGKTDGAEELLT